MKKQFRLVLGLSWIFISGILLYEKLVHLREWVFASNTHLLAIVFVVFAIGFFIVYPIAWILATIRITIN